MILFPRASFTIEVNGYRKKLTSPAVNTQIRLTPLLNAKGGATTIKIVSNSDTGDIDALAFKFFLIATPDVRFATSRVRVYITYPENYRAFNWSYRFWLKNYSKSPRYTSFFRTEEKVRNFSSKVVTKILADSTAQGNQKPIRSYSNFFYINPEVYSYKWSAETPNLFLVTSGNFSSRYDASEVLSERVGLRMSEIKKGELRINNVPVRFKAVSYTHPPLEAPVPTTEELREYIIKLKQHHINTIEVHGLPASNDLYNLADEYGLYLIQHLVKDKERISQDETGGDILWLRQHLSVLYQLRNMPSLIAWAVNNSSDDTSTSQVSAFQDSLKTLDPNRPVIIEEEKKSITNFPASSPELEQLTAEGLLKLKKEYQPLSMKISKDSTVSILNAQDFAVLDKVLLQWEITDGDRVVLQGEVGSLDIAPGKSKVVKLPFSFHTYRNNNYSLSLEVKLKEDISWAERGFVLAWEKFDTEALHLLLEK
ncbi:beta-galactosidase domain 4-containing protein [Pontibacter toksunensis]|uniref:beta-galactosidase n=1 Tax=Pontibacter toksunensis TaxID=1332631 RepID=A0ABW6BS30_9BACT